MSSQISYITILQAIESFASAHIQVQKFVSDFAAEIPNLITKDEAFPVLFVTPSDSTFSENATTFAIDVYCLDLIQKDRSNINTILSDTNLILNDLKIWLTNGDLAGIDIIETASAAPINNSMLDYCAGYVASYQVIVDAYGICDIPFNGQPIISGPCNNITYSNLLTCDTLADCPIIIQIQEQISGITSGGQIENFNWKFKTGTDEENPTTGKFAVNALLPSNVTEIFFNDICDQSGFDISKVFSTILGYWDIYFQDTDDATRFALFSTTASTYIDNGGWWTVPVEFKEGTVLPFNNAKCSFLFINKNAGVNTGTTININGVTQDLSQNRSWLTAQASTGILHFGTGLTGNTSTSIRISAMDGYIVNNESNPTVPTHTFVNYAGSNNVPVTTINSGIASYVLLDNTGTPYFQNTFPTSAERKSSIWIGKVAHPNGMITAVINEPDFITSPLAQLRDLFQSLTYINKGVYPYPNGANTKLNITFGTIIGDGINLHNSNTIPNEIQMGPEIATPFFYRTQTGGTSPATTGITGGFYDVSGATVAVPSTASTIQWIFCVPDTGFVIQFGQTLYGSLNEAVTAIGREQFVVFPSLVENAILIGLVALTSTATTLNDTSQAQFFRADKFGQIVSSQVGVSTSPAPTLQQVYDVSAQPQITTNPLLGALQIKGTGTAPILQGLNVSNNVRFNVNANGGLTASTISATTYVNIPYWTGGTGANSIVQRGSVATAFGAFGVSEGFQSQANGDYSHCEGFSSVAQGDASHAEGIDTLAFGLTSHAEGQLSQALGSYAHAEGFQTVASGESSHAEGYLTQANGQYSHAEGDGSKANGFISHAEGLQTLSNGNYSHAEGVQTLAFGDLGTHAEGYQTSATSQSSHSEGQGTLSSGQQAHAEGRFTRATGPRSHAEGDSTSATTDYAHSEGFQSRATGQASHSEGSATTATGNVSHAEGQNTTALGVGSHAEGSLTQANGANSHAEGQSTIASGPNGAHAEGFGGTAAGQSSHVEGFSSDATGDVSHAEGVDTLAAGFASHSEGQLSRANGSYAHAEGFNTRATGIASHAGGSGSTTNGTVGFVHGLNSLAGTGSSINVLGSNITGNTAHNTYLDGLNIKTLGTGTSVTTLGRDANGFIVASTGGGGSGDTLWTAGGRNQTITNIGGGNSVDTMYTLAFGKNNTIFSNTGSSASNNSVFGEDHYLTECAWSFVAGSVHFIEGGNNTMVLGNQNEVHFCPISFVTGNLNILNFGSSYSNILGYNNNVGTNSPNSFIFGDNNIIPNSLPNVTIVGNNITPTLGNNTYVEGFNIKNLGPDPAVEGIGRDANGFIVSTGVVTQLWVSGTGLDSIIHVDTNFVANTAAGEFSLAFGSNANVDAFGRGSVSMGEELGISDANSAAFGKLNAITSGAFSSFVAGEQNIVGGQASAAFGIQNFIGTPASNNFIAGSSNVSDAPNSVIFGSTNTNVGTASNSFIAGSGNNIFLNGLNAAIFGSNHVVNSENCFVAGLQHTIAPSSDNSACLGYLTQISNTSPNSFIFGNNSLVDTNSNNSLNIGMNNFIWGDSPYSIIIGSNSSIATNGGGGTLNSTIIGNGSTIPDGLDGVFIIGNAIIGTQSNTTFVDGLNIRTLGANPAVNNLGIDANGFVVIGAAGSATTVWTQGSAGAFTIKAINDSTTDATADYSVAEGYNTLASGTFGSHSEGLNTQAIGNFGSHAEGSGSIASGQFSHAEGNQTQAQGDASHTEGSFTVAMGPAAHAEGDTTQAHSNGAHAEGIGTVAQSGQAPHAEGYNTIALGTGSHAEGVTTQANGEGSHAEGFGSVATGTYSHAEGTGTQANGVASHAAGNGAIANGDYSYAGGGGGTTADGLMGFAHGYNVHANNTCSVVLGAQGITSSQEFTTYVGDFVIKKADLVLPTTSSDATGEVGNITWDDTYIYIKTNAGWGRTLLDYGW